MLAYFYLAIPVGSALGYVVGGLVGNSTAGDNAFYVAGLPGLLLAVLVTRLPSRPGPKVTEMRQRAPDPVRGHVPYLVRSPAWRINTVGTTLMAFSMGGSRSGCPASSSERTG